jgi:hypothetical protein
MLARGPGSPGTQSNLEGGPMEIPKDKIIELIRNRGDHDQADQAEQELPDTVDTDRDRGLLDKFGVDPKEVLGKLGVDIPGL